MSNVSNLQTCSTDRWHVLGRVCARVHYNGSNMVMATECHLEWESVSCFAHMPQLAANDGFKVASVN